MPLPRNALPRRGRCTTGIPFGHRVRQRTSKSKNIYGEYVLPTSGTSRGRPPTHPLVGADVPQAFPSVPTSAHSTAPVGTQRAVSGSMQYENIGFSANSYCGRPSSTPALRRRSPFPQGKVLAVRFQQFSIPAELECKNAHKIRKRVCKLYFTAAAEKR